MASTRFGTANQGRQMASPRPKTRDSKDTLCRNVLIYGHCRYEDQGCAFNHDQNRNSNNSSDQRWSTSRSRRPTKKTEDSLLVEEQQRNKQSLF
ncbi:hypothetical protein F4824DRAFT_359968 [Ustulina deusta]|nr:hypothetical protein F4824DRAFT_359968 [Ustulina deusta]